MNRRGRERAGRGRFSARDAWESARRPARGKPKSLGSAYAYWFVGLFICPGLHRFYLGRHVTGFLMILLALAAIGAVIIGFGELYAYYFSLLGTGTERIYENPEEIAGKWFSLAAVPAVALLAWMVVDLFLMSRMVEKSRTPM